MEVPCKSSSLQIAQDNIGLFFSRNEREREGLGSTELFASEILFWLSMVICLNDLHKPRGTLLLFQ